MKTVTWIGILAAAVAISACRLDATYSIGGTVTGLLGSGMVLQNSSGKYLSVIANGSFTFPSGVANNGTYSVTVKTQPTNPAQTCTVQNGIGTVAKADVTNVLVTCSQAGRFAYVANQVSNTISAFLINTGGVLTPIAGSPYLSSGAAPVSVTVDPNGAFLYVADNGSNDVSVYAIDALTGALSPSGVSIPVGVGPTAVAIDPTNQFLYVANFGANTVSAFTIDGGNGVAIAGAPYLVGRGPIALKTDPGGKFLYVTNFTDGNVSVFQIASDTGQLTPISGSPFGAAAGAVSIAIAPSGAFAYVANETAASISTYAVDASTGHLAAVAGSPSSTVSSPESVVVNPAGTFVYAANVTSKNNVANYAIAPSTGILTLGATVAAGVFPLSIAVDPSGLFVYAANDSSASVSVYSVDTTSGALTQVRGSPFPAGNGSRSIAID